MTDENSDIKSLDPCLPEEYLRAYALGKVTKPGLRAVIEAHVELCAECAAKVRSFQRTKLSPEELLQKQLASLRQRQAALKRQSGQGPRPGTIWRSTVPWTRKGPGPLVFVLSSPALPEKKSLTVAEVSEDISQAIETDMILDPQKSGLRFRCMVRAGNIFATDPQDLKHFAGELPTTLTETVLEFCELGEHFDDKVPLSQFVFLRDEEGNRLMRRKGVTSGMLVTDDSDPRLVLLSESRSQCRYLHIAQQKAEKPKAGSADIKKLISLVHGLVSKLSMWGELVEFTPIPLGIPAHGFGEYELDLGDSGEEFSFSLDDIPESETIQTPEETADPTLEERRLGPTKEALKLKALEERVFELGDTIKLSVVVPEDGYLVVVHYCEQRSELEIILPRPEKKDAGVVRDEEIRIERKLMNPGDFGFKVIFTRKALFLPEDASGDPSRMRESLFALIEKIRQLDEEEWREADYEYEVLPEEEIPTQ